MVVEQRVQGGDGMPSTRNNNNHHHRHNKIVEKFLLLMPRLLMIVEHNGSGSIFSLLRIYDDDGN